MKPAIVSHYDREKYNSLVEYARRPEVNYTHSQLYTRVKKQKVAPAFKYRLPGKRGRGTAVYLIADLKDALKQCEEKEENTVSAYNPVVLVSVKEAGEMLPVEWGIPGSAVSILLRAFGIEAAAFLKRPDTRGPHQSLYKVEEVKNMIILIEQERKVK